MGRGCCCRGPIRINTCCSRNGSNRQRLGSLRWLPPKTLLASLHPGVFAFRFPAGPTVSITRNSTQSRRGAKTQRRNGIEHSRSVVPGCLRQRPRFSATKLMSGLSKSCWQKNVGQKDGRRDARRGAARVQRREQGNERYKRRIYFVSPATYCSESSNAPLLHFSVASCKDKVASPCNLRVSALCSFVAVLDKELRKFRA